ncbi:MAG: WD40 repeat domain-containing protein, partial [Planctomycetota bacterium]
LAAGDQAGHLRVWDVSDWAEIAAWHQPDAITAVAHSATGDLVATGGASGTVRLWRPGRPEPVATLRGHDTPVRCVALVEADTEVVAGSEANELRRWRVEDAELIALQSGPDGATWCMAVDPRGRFAASNGVDGRFVVWSTRTGDVVGILAGSVSRQAHDMTFSQDGTRVLAGAWERELLMWERTGSRIAATVTGHTAQANDVAFSPDGRLLACTSDDHTARVWDAATGLPIEIVDAGDETVHGVAFVPGANALITGASDGTVRLLDLDDGESVRLTEHGGSVNDVTVDGRGRLVASAASDGLVHVTSLATLETTATYRAHDDGRCWAVAFDPQGAMLAIGHVNPQSTRGSGVTLRVWDVATGATRREFVAQHANYAKAVAFAPDGSTVASAGSGTVRLWSVESGELVAESERASGIWDHYSIAFTHDGTRLFTTGTDGVVRVLDAGSLDVVMTLRPDDTRFMRVAVSPNDRRVAASTLHGEVVVWTSTDARTMLPDSSVRRLFDELVEPDRVIEEIRSTPWLASDERSEALRLASSIPDDGRMLLSLAWPIVCSPDSSLTDIDRAARQLGYAVEMQTTDARCRVGLALARIRFGDLVAARRELAHLGEHDQHAAVASMARVARLLVDYRDHGAEPCRAAYTELERDGTLASSARDHHFSRVARAVRRHFEPVPSSP